MVNLRAYWRFLRVIRQFFPLVFAYARDRRRFLAFGGRRQVGPETQRRRAEALLDSLLTLGPTFIKLGQLLSTRPDILPPAYIDVLSRLQDDVPPADWEDARTVVEEELGPVDEVFDEFDTDPISGASLGQVYAGTYEGRRVAVKVRRPGVESLVEADLRVIKWLLPVILYFVDDARSYSMRNLADEFDKTIREEMDYQREARMLEAIRANFRDNDDVAIPEVVAEVSDARVLTMEYLGGTKITRIEELDAMGVDRSELAEKLQRAYLQMMVQDGVFHADPHPGNLAVTADGTIVFYDFGMSGFVDEYVQNQIVEFYVAVARQDIDGIIDTLIALGTLSPEADRDVMRDVMELAIRDARGEMIENYRVQQIIQQVEDTIYEFPLRLPRNLALVLRVATVVEGVCVTLDEDFDFITVATGYLREQGYFEETAREQLGKARKQVRDSAESVVRVPPKLEGVLDRIQRDNVTVGAEIEDPHDVFDDLAERLIYGMLLSAGLLSTAVLYALGDRIAALVAVLLTIPLFLLLYRSFRDPRTIATPQFTRQSMRELQAESEEAEDETGMLGPRPTDLEEDEKVSVADRSNEAADGDETVSAADRSSEAADGDGLSRE
jgi:predicted unusual protein kinase regulating ubiquinone biosynthesis (AarF/ABC1/UbiB family)